MDKIARIKEKWNDILNYMKDEYEISPASFKAWLRILTPYSFSKDTLVIVIDFNKSDGTINYIRNKYYGFLKASIAEIASIECDISFIFKEEIMDNSNVNKIIKLEDSNLNRDYTFDSFVVGNNNQLALAAATAVAEEPGTVYNPLFIYGGVGLGKTHLMQAIAHYIIDHNQDKKVLYTTCENFTNDLTKALREKTGEKFREKYRSSDVLIIDDIQFISKKEATQEELFHTFNTLYETKRQIVIASDRPPIDLQNLDERLRTRFQMGVTVDISVPDYETRLSILQKKSEEKGYNISHDILDLLATRISSNVRVLASALEKIVAFSKLSRREITEELALEAIKDDIGDNNKKTVTIASIVNMVAENYQLTPAEIYSKNRTANIAYPRHIAVYLCRKCCGDSLTDIGKAFGGRDHATIMNSINRIEKEISTDPILQEKINLFMKKINS